MDIAAMSIALNQGKVQQQAALSVMKQSMDLSKLQGEGLEKLMASAEMPQAPHPQLGHTIDVKV